MEVSNTTVIFSFLAFFLTTLGCFWKIAHDFRKDLTQAIKEIETSSSETTRLLFKRFDAHKEATDKKFDNQLAVSDARYASHAICELVRSTYEKQFNEINRKLDILLEERRKV